MIFSTKYILSVIIPIYNCDNFIIPTIRSIQNQNIYPIEIILINDFSNDNSLNIIKDLAFEDKRIKIINNNKNMGTLYSRCIGTLNAKGQYIFPLDHDDLFMNSNILNIIYNQAKRGNYDIVGFNAVRGFNYNLNISELQDDVFHNHSNNLILHQPELGVFSFTKDNQYIPNDLHIWGKCINSLIYKKAINALGRKKYSLYICWAEDSSMIFILNNFSNSYKYISKYGVFHLMSEKTASFTQTNNSKIFGEIFLMDIIYDFSKNDYESKKLVIGKALEIRHYDFFNLEDNYNFNFMKYALKKILNSKYISIKDKDILIDNYKNFNLFL